MASFYKIQIHNPLEHVTNNDEQSLKCFAEQISNNFLNENVDYVIEVSVVSAGKLFDKTNILRNTQFPCFTALTAIEDSCVPFIMTNMTLDDYKYKYFPCYIDACFIKKNEIVVLTNTFHYLDGNENTNIIKIQAWDCEYYKFVNAPNVIVAFEYTRQSSIQLGGLIPIIKNSCHFKCTELSDTFYEEILYENKLTTLTLTNILNCENANIQHLDEYSDNCVFKLGSTDIISKCEFDEYFVTYGDIMHRISTLYHKPCKDIYKLSNVVNVNHIINPISFNWILNEFNIYSSSKNTIDLSPNHYLFRLLHSHFEYLFLIHDELHFFNEFKLDVNDIVVIEQEDENRVNIRPFIQICVWLNDNNDCESGYAFNSKILNNKKCIVFCVDIKF